jgi:hypothetical protein
MNTAEKPKKPRARKAPQKPPQAPPTLSALPDLYPAGQSVFGFLYDEMAALADTLSITIDDPVGIYPTGESETGFLLRQLQALEVAAGDAAATLSPLYPAGESLIAYFYDELSGIAGGGGGGGGTPGQPVNLVVTTISDTELNLTWDLSDANDTALYVERCATNSANDEDWAPVATLSGGWRTWTDRSLYPSQTWYYRVSPNSGPVSAVASATTAAAGSTSGFALADAGAVVDSPWQVTLAWTSPAVAGDPKVIVERSDNGATFFIRAVVNLVEGAQTWADTPLDPGIVYSYRLRAANGAGYGPYTTPLAADVSFQEAGVPDYPPNLTVTPQSATVAAVEWTDPNGGAATYLVEKATVPGAGTPDTATWTQVAETAAGAQVYALTTVANTPLYVRVRANISGAHSAYSPVALVRPPSGANAAHTYDIGPGQDVETLGAFDWSSLLPGDTVQVHSGTYAEKLALTCRGTATHRITITGVDDGDGLPVITGLEATTDDQFVTNHTFEDLALVHFGKLAAQPNGHQAGYITFQNFVLQSAYQNNSPATYTAADGSTRSYVQGAAGIYIGRGDHLTIQGCEITDCSNGIFGAADGSDVRDISDIAITNCHVHGNGTPAGFSEHNIYMEGARTTYQGNLITALRATSGGSCLKDRGPGLVVRANWIEGAARLLDIVETQNGILKFLADPAYGKSYVWGNVLKNAGEASIPIHYGGDSSGDWYYRKGYLFFSHNTFVNRMDAADQFRVSWFFVSAPSGVCVATNNVYWVEKATGPGTRPEVDLFIDDTGNVAATGAFGANLVTIGWRACRAGVTFAGKAAGTEAFISPADNDFGFVDASGDDFHLDAGSAAIGAGGRLPGDHPAVNRQYTDLDTTSRSTAGTGADLGAYSS